MANLNGFNANEVDPAVGFDPIPAGKYLAIITESEMKPTKAGTGQYLQLTFQVLEGQYKGRLVWARLNLDNIAKALLDALEHGGIYEDDSQIDRLEIVRASVIKSVAVIVEINEINAIQPHQTENQT